MISVLIFTYNRHEFLKRTLNYWASEKVNVIVADATKQLFNGSVPQNVRYLHMPDTSIKNRIMRMLDYANTPYVVLCADDDFLASEGLSKTVDFLNNNSDYAAAQGLYLRFWNDFPWYISNWIFDYRYSISYKFDSDLPSERYINAMKTPVMHYCYSVMRPEAMRNSLALLDGLEEESISTLELSFIPGIMLEGKYATVPVFFSARQGQVPNWGNGLSFDSWCKKQSPAGFARWRGNIINLFSKKDSTLFNTHFPNILDEAIKGYCQNSEAKKLHSVAAKKTANIFSSFIKCLLKPIIYFLKLQRDRIVFLGLDINKQRSFSRDLAKIKSCINSKKSV